MWKVSVAMALVATGADGHGWLVEPLSKNEMAKNHFVSGMPTVFRYEPQSSAGPNACGASGKAYCEGLDKWQTFYDSQGLAVPELVPGGDFKVRFKLTADHSGQAWIQVACGGGEISENSNWTILERSEFARGSRFMPSHPGIYPWKSPLSANKWGETYYHVPSWFSCPTEQAYGRWIWKVGNTCNDFSNVGKKTESFSKAEYLSAGGSGPGVCQAGPETFISCFDAKVTGPAQPTPAPAPVPSPTPTTTVFSSPSTAAPITSTAAPTSTTTPGGQGACMRNMDCSVNAWCADVTYDAYCRVQTDCPGPQCVRGTSNDEPTPDPEPVPTPTPSQPEPKPEPEPEPITCVATPGLNRGVSDHNCAQCATGYKWWPCNEEGLCQCAGTALVQVAPHVVSGKRVAGSRKRRALLATHHSMIQLTQREEL